MTVALVRYDEACRALADAKSTDEAKHIHDTAEAMRAYARQAKNKQLEVDAAEIRIRAERRLGELIRGQKETVGMNRGGLLRGSAREPRDPRPTLAEAGITKKLSSRAQKLAAVPDDEFESEIADWRERIKAENERVTVSLLARGKRASEKPTFETRTAERLEVLIERGYQFGTIYADPPWLYSNQGTRAATSNHYDGLTVEDIAALPIGDLALPDAHLHLWTTNAFLFDAPRIFEAWGFEFRSSFVWVKPQLGIGNYWRNSHEFLLTAIRGNAKRFSERTLKSWAEFDRTRHSAKPEAIRRLIELASPGPYLELFGRREIDNWVVWGNEISADLFTQAKRIA